MTARIAELTVLVLLATSSLGFEVVAQLDAKASMAKGKEIYESQCGTCHGPQGAGTKGIFPPLANSDYLNANRARAIKIVLHGLTGKITVNGAGYDSEMMSLDMTDQQVSDVLNYARNCWGNKGDLITPEQVSAVRKQSTE